MEILRKPDISDYSALKNMQLTGNQLKDLNDGLDEMDKSGSFIKFWEKPSDDLRNQVDPIMHRVLFENEFFRDMMAIDRNIKNDRR